MSLGHCSTCVVVSPGQQQRRIVIVQYMYFWAFPSGLSTVSHYVNVINNLVERVNVFLSRRESKGSLHLSRKCTSQMLVLKAPQGMGGEILLSLHNSKSLGGGGTTAQILPFPFHQGHSKRKKKRKTLLVISFILQFTVSSQQYILVTSWLISFRMSFTCIQSRL